MSVCLFDVYIGLSSLQGSQEEQALGIEKIIIPLWFIVILHFIGIYFFRLTNFVLSLGRL